LSTAFKSEGRFSVDPLTCHSCFSLFAFHLVFENVKQVFSSLLKKNVIVTLPCELDTQVVEENSETRVVGVSESTAGKLALENVIVSFLRAHYLKNRDQCMQLSEFRIVWSEKVLLLLPPQLNYFLTSCPKG